MLHVFKFYVIFVRFSARNVITPPWDSKVSVIKIDWLETREGSHPLSLLQHSSGLVLAKSWNFTMMSCHDTFYLKTFYYPNTDSEHKISTKEIDVTLRSVNFIEL